MWNFRPSKVVAGAKQVKRMSRLWDAALRWPGIPGQPLAGNGGHK